MQSEKEICYHAIRKVYYGMFIMAGYFPQRLSIYLLHGGLHI